MKLKELLTYANPHEPIELVILRDEREGVRETLRIEKPESMHFIKYYDYDVKFFNSRIGEEGYFKDYPYTRVVIKNNLDTQPLPIEKRLKPRKIKLTI